MIPNLFQRLITEKVVGKVIRLEYVTGYGDPFTNYEIRDDSGVVHDGFIRGNQPMSLLDYVEVYIRKEWSSLRGSHTIEGYKILQKGPVTPNKGPAIVARCGAILFPLKNDDGTEKPRAAITATSNVTILPLKNEND
jgi:hypothetical protein